MKKLVLLLLLGSLFLYGCGGGSSSGGSSRPAPTKEVCQACTTNDDCKSGRCSRFSSGIFRCVPGDAEPGYRCPAGFYKMSEPEVIQLGG